MKAYEGPHGRRVRGAEELTLAGNNRPTGDAGGFLSERPVYPGTWPSPTPPKKAETSTAVIRGSTFIRQGLIRYTDTAPDVGALSVALENPVSYVYNNTGSTVTMGFSKAPDLVVRWDKGYDWGNVSVRGVTQKVAVIDDGAGLNASRRGHGLGVTTLVKLRDAQDFLRLALTYGNGIGRDFNDIEGAFLDVAGKRIVLERAVGVVAGYQFKASDTLRYNLVGGWQQNLHSAYTDFALANGLGAGQYGINKRVYQLHAGAIYNPVRNLDLGAEYIHGQRQTLVGEKAALSRVNLMARYSFN